MCFSTCSRSICSKTCWAFDSFAFIHLLGCQQERYYPRAYSDMADEDVVLFSDMSESPQFLQMCIHFILSREEMLGIFLLQRYNLSHSFFSQCPFIPFLINAARVRQAIQRCIPRSLVDDHSASVDNEFGHYISTNHHFLFENDIVSLKESEKREREGLIIKNHPRRRKILKLSLPIVLTDYKWPR